MPLLATDPYGHFVPGPERVPADRRPPTGDWSRATPAGTGDPVPTPSRTGHAFLDDIAHHAVPTGDRDPTNGPGPIGRSTPDADAGTTDDGDPTTYDDEMLNAHFVAGDGRVNENIGLTAVHHVFHSEHNRLARRRSTT